MSADPGWWPRAMGLPGRRALKRAMESLRVAATAAPLAGRIETTVELMRTVRQADLRARQPAAANR